MLGTVQKCGEILGLFTPSSPDWGISELSATLNQPKSSVHAVVSSLAEIGLLQRMAGGRYRLGWRISAMNRVLFGSLDFHERAQPVLQGLVDRFGETVHLGVLDWSDVVIVSRHHGTHAVMVPGAAVGERRAAAFAAIGKALLACRSDDEVRHLHGNARPHAEYRPDIRRPSIDLAPLLSELSRVRRETVAYNIGPEVCSVGSPVWDSANQPVAAISMSVPSYRFHQSPGLLAQAIRGAADRISGLLGASGSVEMRWSKQAQQIGRRPRLVAGL